MMEGTIPHQPPGIEHSRPGSLENEYTLYCYSEVFHADLEMTLLIWTGGRCREVHAVQHARGPLSSSIIASRRAWFASETLPRMAKLPSLCSCTLVYLHWTVSFGPGLTLKTMRHYLHHLDRVIANLMHATSHARQLIWKETDTDVLHLANHSDHTGCRLKKEIDRACVSSQTCRKSISCFRLGWPHET